MVDKEIIFNWLLDQDNPGVRIRTLTNLCGLPLDHEKVRASCNLVIKTLPAANDLSWTKLKGQILVYNLTALAESGLSYKDIPIEMAASKLLSQSFDAGCGELMALRALVMLGYGSDQRIKECLTQFRDAQLPDGGWLCLHRVRKMSKVPKSCIRAAMHGLLLAAELKKQGLHFDGDKLLAAYFLKRRLFYRTDNPTRLVLNDHPGRRMTNVFFPIEYFRVGLPLLLDALSVLGVGNASELQDAWSLLDEKKDSQGRIILEGTLPLKKSYLPKERVGKPSKWGTLYAYLAWKNKDEFRRGN